jgi:hypothetical protein
MTAPIANYAFPIFTVLLLWPFLSLSAAAPQRSLVFTSDHPLGGTSSANENPIREDQHQQNVVSNALEWVTKTRYALQVRSQYRTLQDTNTNSGTNQTVLKTPEEVCQDFNNQTVGILTCNCSRFGTRDTQVDCTYDSPQCSTDNSTCYTGSISQILNEEFDVRAVTSCSTFTKSVVETPDAETCIRVFPIAVGNFSSIESCSASFKPTGSNEAKICASCSVCKTDAMTTTTANSGNSTVDPKITIDCCNLKTDLKQTCGAVSAMSGAAVPLFDMVTAENMGMCTSGSTTLRFYWFTMMISVVVASSI